MNQPYYTTNDYCFAYVYDYELKKYYLGISAEKKFEKEFINYFQPKIINWKVPVLYHLVEFNNKKEMLYNFNSFINTINYNNDFHHEYTEYNHNDLIIKKTINHKKNKVIPVWFINYSFDIKDKNLDNQKLDQIANGKTGINYFFRDKNTLAVLIYRQTRKEAINDYYEIKELILD